MDGKKAAIALGALAALGVGSYFVLQAVKGQETTETCTEGAIRCDGTVSQECKDGKWVSGGGLVCSDGGETSEKCKNVSCYPSMTCMGHDLYNVGCNPNTGLCDKYTLSQREYGACIDRKPNLVKLMYGDADMVGQTLTMYPGNLDWGSMCVHSPDLKYKVKVLDQWQQALPGCNVIVHQGYQNSNGTIDKPIGGFRIPKSGDSRVWCGDVYLGTTDANGEIEVEWVLLHDRGKTTSTLCTFTFDAYDDKQRTISGRTYMAMYGVGNPFGYLCDPMFDFFCFGQGDPIFTCEGKTQSTCNLGNPGDL